MGLLMRPSTPLPTGFRADPNRGGLIVPTEESRRRDVLTSDDRRALDRAIKRVLGPYEIKFLLLCGHEGCPDPKIDRIERPDGSYVLRCGHADRVLQAAF